MSKDKPRSRESKTINVAVDTPSILGFLGGTILFLGVFAPIVRAPIFGSLNYFQNGKGDGVILLVAGVLSIFSTARRKFLHLWFTGGISLACALFTVGRFTYTLHQLKESVAKQGDAPSLFSGMMSTALNNVELQWGLPLLMVGAVLVLLAAAIGTGKLSIKISNPAS